MNGTLPTLTWGTWDEGTWDAQRGATPHSTVQPQPDERATSNYGNSTRSKRKLLRKGLTAPVQSQLWFEELLARILSDPSLESHLSPYQCNPLHCWHDTPGPGHARSEAVQVIPWDTLPQGIHPRDGKLPASRIRSKRLQVDNLAVFLQHVLRPGDTVVEFCAGSGYVALPLACLFPDCRFVLLDMKEPSLAIARERIAAAGLTNVDIFCGFIDDYDERFDVGIALHACGEATDMVMDKCLKSNAAYVLAPCCVGKIKLSALEYPRSQQLSKAITRTEFEVLAKAADFGHLHGALCQSEVNLRRRRCKTLLERDRNMRAGEHGYRTFMFAMHPFDITPKNDVLVGLPDCKWQSRPFTLPCYKRLSDEQALQAIFGGQSHSSE